MKQRKGGQRVSSDLLKLKAKLEADRASKEEPGRISFDPTEKEPINKPPMLPQEVIGRMLEAHKKEISAEIQSLREDVYAMLVKELDDRRIARNLRIRNGIKYLIGSIPGSVGAFLVFLMG